MSTHSVTEPAIAGHPQLSERHPARVFSRPPQYGIRRTDGAWWSDLLGRFVHAEELPDLQQLQLVASQFDFLTIAEGYGMLHVPGELTTWRAVPFVTVEGFNGRPAVRL